jgi:hypothetical protein
MAKLSMSTVKAKGRETENLFVSWLNSKFGMSAERRRLKGTQDEGDITGWDGVCVEVKSASGSTVNITGWLRELAAEIQNSGADVGFIAARPKGKPDPEDWYAIIPLPALVDLLMEHRNAPRD